jgi:molybdopterin molybdotransferase
MALMPVKDALAAVLKTALLMPSETIAIDNAFGRTLAEPLKAIRSQPPTDVSAMDGYAVRAADLAVGAMLTVTGESAAGHPFKGVVGLKEAVRIFTGAAVPYGADTIVIQENAERSGRVITVSQPEAIGRHIRRRGLDFNLGDACLEAGQLLHARAIALVAALGHGKIAVRRKPRIGILATGDELVLPGAAFTDDDIIASNHLTTAAIIENAGGEAIQLGIAKDSLRSLNAAIAQARSMQLDALVTLGGASVGDHDLVSPALRQQGLSLTFWKIAMRPGKPMMFGTLDAMTILGLPGNPVSSFVCAKLFLAPMIRAMLGDPSAAEDQTWPGALGTDLPENDHRMDFLRATIDHRSDRTVVLPLTKQDSSMISTMTKAQSLLIREPHAPPAREGDACRYLLL